MSNLFIGIGGSGCRIVSKVQKSYAGISTSQGFTDDNLFLYVDIDPSSIEQLRNKKNTSIIDLSRFRIADYYYGEFKKNLNTWFDGENIIIPSMHVNQASGVRQISRMAFLMDPSARQIIEHLIDYLLSDNNLAISQNCSNLDALKVYVVSSSVGGAGSGILYDLLYTMWRYIIDAKGLRGNFDVTAVILMPNTIINGQHNQQLISRYKLNGYAFIQETNALVKVGMHTHLNDQFYNYFNGKQSGIPEHTWQPFQKVILVDNLNSRYGIPQKDLYEIASEFLFSYTYGQLGVGTEIINNTDGYSFSIQHLQNSALTNCEPDRDKEYPEFFSSFAMVMMKTAGEYFAQYTKCKLKKDVLMLMLGSRADIDDNLLQQIINYINEKVGGFIQNNHVKVARWLTKEEKRELISVVSSLDFSKPIPSATGKKAKEFSSDLIAIQRGLVDLRDRLAFNLLNLLSEYAYRFSLNQIINALTAADGYFCGSFAENKDRPYVSEYSDLEAMVISKMNLYVSHALSKGSEYRNDKGIFDALISHFTGFRNELELLVNNVDSGLQEVIHDFSDKRNSCIKVLPGYDEVIELDGTSAVFKPNGPFNIWYDNIGFKIEEIRNKLVSPLIDTNNPADRILRLNENDNLQKYRVTVDENLEKIVAEEINVSVSYKNIVNKTVYELLNESGLDANKFSESFKGFNEPFIKLNMPKSTSRIVFAGYFNGSDSLLCKLGYEPNNIDHILIDDVIFSDRIIKMAFTNKIALDEYFLFNLLKSNYNENYRSPKLEGKSISSPFIHKEFSGENFDGDVFNVLNKNNHNN